MEQELLKNNFERHGFKTSFFDTKEAAFKTFASMCINRQLINAVTVSNRKKNMP